MGPAFLRSPISNVHVNTGKVRSMCNFLLAKRCHQTGIHIAEEDEIVTFMRN